MKKLFFFSLAGILISSISFAKIWRVNNNPGVQADFTTAQQAHDGANAGDTLYFEHSTSFYGDLYMTKRLTLIGAGAFAVNNPGQQYNLSAPSIGDIGIAKQAEGVVIMVNASLINDTADHLTVTRCYIENGAYLYDADSCTFFQAFLYTVRANLIPQNRINDYAEYGSYGITVNNCFLQSLISDVIKTPASGQGNCFPASSFLCYNNTINGIIQACGTFFNNYIATTITTDEISPVYNNLFQTQVTQSQRYYINNSFCQANVVSLSTGNGNQFGIPSTDVFVANLNSTTTALDTTFRLKPDSPAIGAGVGGTDVGATGGLTPYRFGVQPAIPAIYKLDVITPLTGNSINVTVSTKSNN
jgi:hypothetical protein